MRKGKIISIVLVALGVQCLVAAAGFGWERLKPLDHHPFQDAPYQNMESDVIDSSQGQGLQPYKGRYFHVGIPQGWQVNENMNGIEVVAPDRVTGYSCGFVTGYLGEVTPRSFLNMVLQRGPYTNPHFEWVRNLPDQQGPMGFIWKSIEAELQFGYLGVQVRAHVVCGVFQGGVPGMKGVVLRSYQIALPNWKQQQALLAQIDTTLRFISPGEFTRERYVLLPHGTAYKNMDQEDMCDWTDRQSFSVRNTERLRKAMADAEPTDDSNLVEVYKGPHGDNSDQTEREWAPLDPDELR